MPVYEFRCRKCEKVTEELCKLNESISKCPFCGGKMKKMISKPGPRYRFMDSYGS